MDGNRALAQSGRTCRNGREAAREIEAARVAATKWAASKKPIVGPTDGRRTVGGQRVAEQQTRARQPERHDQREKRPAEGDIRIDDDGQTKRDGEGDGRNTAGATEQCPEPEWPDSGRNGRNGRNTAEAAGIAGQRPEWPNGLDRTTKRRPEWAEQRRTTTTVMATTRT